MRARTVFLPAADRGINRNLGHVNTLRHELSGHALGKTGLADNYAQALIDQGATARMIDADGITLSGLGRAHAADQQEADI